MLVLQSLPGNGSLTAYVGTFLVLALGYAFTVHVAARYVLGETPFRRALAVGAVPALFSLALQRYTAAIVLVLLADLAAIHVVYRVNWKRAGLVAVVHYAITVLVTLALFNVLRLLSSAPA